MRIVLDPHDVQNAFRSFLTNVKKDCRVVTTQVGREGNLRECEAFVNDTLGYWVAHEAVDDRHRILFGMGDPARSPEPVVAASFTSEGFDRRSNGLFFRFGRDVLVALAVGVEDGDVGLAHFLQHHEYGLARHTVTAPDAVPLEAVILSSVLSQALAYNIFHFVSAANDCRQWTARGLTAGKKEKFLTGPRPCAGDSGPGGRGTEEPRLRRLVEEGVREQLLRSIEARKLPLTLGWTPSGDLALASPDHTVLAALLVGTSLDPDVLFSAVGRLILSRSTLRAAKILVVPGVLGPFFTQALFRHDIHVATYKLTQDMAVVIDTDAVFKAIQTV